MQKPYRLTPARRALIEIFTDKPQPISVQKIGLTLHDKGVIVNKTTIYRELNFLLEKKLIQEVLINSKKSFYESAKLEHHHHFICNSCGEIDDVILDKDLSQTEKTLERKKKIKIEKHSLEFFGLCAKCQ